DYYCAMWHSSTYALF
nr:immunoglobulin light chain junction region [Macaca mulatta]